jgi:hypothetical protein
MKSLLKNYIWQYVNDRYENDGVLVDADEVYKKFELEFTIGAKLEWIDEVVYNFSRCNDLTGIDIQYEGEIYERSLS